ncbi:FRG domain-containing protein [Vibrio sp. 1865]|uniref:FRG domain-containing protein n=1 Tax=Vibrio TaxID=662 RepID=UPI000DFC9EA8|nr:MULTISPECIES: FRG domain-containing protein [Vibrio]MDW2094498.1 FRG domain-containing protein [Vibrio sp. 1866]MDW3104322.1 FRG domain-containing protein [Vibrio sp. 1874]MDW3169838.1 FRG domain-containing protein [Vibrio sp. Y184]MDW3202303.1 FRG domain-containing protein [Vibrio sp. 1865]URQ95413.1 FRG domain-containing protein [Vibrio sp. SCSIO 43097]
MEVIEINGAKSFLKAVTFENPKFPKYKNESRKYIFRGQSDASWEAVPSAFRANSRLLTDGKLPSLSWRTNRDQIEAEFYTLSMFAEELNRNGFHLPNEDVLNIDTYGRGFIKFITEIGRGEAVWPPRSFHSLIAIAQHYGIPTRFLDFTYDPMVALYFAVKGAMESNNSGFISLYAIHSQGFNIRSFDFERSVDDRFGNSPTSGQEKSIYQVIKSPTSFNHNLRSQKGLFLAYIEKEFRANDILNPESLDQYIMRTTNFDVNYKFVTKVSNAPKLLKLLHDRFYSASSLFPSIEGCVQGLYEQKT